MKMMKRLNAMFLLLVMTVTVGCGGSDDPDPGPIPTAGLTCVITKRVTSYDSTEFKYNNSGKLFRINFFNTDGSYNFHNEVEYNAAGTISEMKTFNQTAPEMLQTFTFNADNLPENITYYRYDAAGNQIKTATEHFVYNAVKQIETIRTYRATDSVITFYTDFTYPGPNEVKQMKYQLTQSNNYQLQTTTLTGYNNFDRPYSALNYFNTSYLGYPQFKTTQTVTNHITGITYSFTYTYTYNAQGYPIKIVNNTLNAVEKNEYNCQ